MQKRNTTHFLDKTTEKTFIAFYKKATLVSSATPQQSPGVMSSRTVQPAT